MMSMMMVASMMLVLLRQHLGDNSCRQEFDDVGSVMFPAPHHSAAALGNYGVSDEGAENHHGDQEADEFLGGCHCWK
ncbi:hypothetical protein JTE90_010551 [Oedothorax gibbosus]|uniref:Secreted protein n=1 Tax=Oedothorax gibbosus TaxID=931172 RepID=A0AAV6U4Z8_9ARAC|nr:hypothetical protein JTE90_010551 [Oedothorax gibbosus]